jgi:hypothetical protein
MSPCRVPCGNSLNALLSFLDYYIAVHFVDTEWLLSTLFDASLLSLEPPENGGSFL